jgi:hypothetical protein
MDETQILQLLRDVLPVLIPILLIQLGLIVYALVDLSKRKNVRGGKTLWVVLLILTAGGFPTGIVSAAVYLAWARHTEE